MSDRPTPETDAQPKHIVRHNYAGVVYVPEDFARTLERQRDEARELLRTGSVCALAIDNQNIRDWVEHWEQRAIKAEAACAAMRKTLERLFPDGRPHTGGAVSGFPDGCECEACELHDTVARVLKLDCGTDWVSPEEHARVKAEREEYKLKRDYAAQLAQQYLAERDQLQARINEWR